MGLLLLKVAFDVISLFLVMILVVERDKTNSRKSAIRWLLVIFGYFLVNQILVTNDGNKLEIVLHPDINFLLVNGIDGLIGLIFLTLLMNSTFLKGTNVEIIFLTLFGFIIWFLLRLFSVGIIDLVSISQWVIHPLTLILAICLYWLLKKSLSAYFRDGFSHFIKLMIVSVFAFLLYMILTTRNQYGLIKQPVFIIFVVLISFAILGWLLYEQKKTQVMENRMKAIEKYIPIIDELVAEVRSRQHEFSNKLLAISSILHSSENIKDAQEQVAKYVDNVQLTRGQYELLNMDHKVIAGFLYTKMKRAEQLNMQLKIERTVQVSEFPCEDYDLIEVLGILIDNAIEACFGGDKIIIRMSKVNDYHELTVSNPADYMTNEQFMQLFKLGYSTKSTFTNERGFGLYNVQQIVKQYNGKIIARNEQEKKMITIGIQI